MGKQLEKLAGLGSGSLIDAGAQSDVRAVPEILQPLYRGWNGFYAFESALHVFPLGKRKGVIDLESWNAPSLWRDAYRDLISPGAVFFAEDAFGGQFVTSGKEISTFDPETGSVEPVARDVEAWAAAILDDYEVLTGYPLAHEWQKAKGSLQPGVRLLPKVPFVLQGEFAISNLYALDAVKGMRLRGDIALQLKDLPDGGKVVLKVVD